MTRLINWVADLIDHVGLAAALSLLATFTLFVAGTAAAYMSDRVYSDWGQLIAFSFVVPAVVIATQTMKKMYGLYRLAVLICLVVSLYNMTCPGSPRFPGMHFAGLWLVLAAYTGMMRLLVGMYNDPGADPRVKRVPLDPAACRLEVPALWAPVFFGIGLVAIVHSWSVVEPLIIVEAPLLAVAFLLHRMVEQELLINPVTT